MTSTSAPPFSTPKTAALSHDEALEWIGSAAQRRRWAPAGPKAVAAAKALWKPALDKLHRLASARP